MGVSAHAIAALALSAAVVARAGAASTPAVPSPVQQHTTRDRIYTKAQAARGSALYGKHCERCHTPAKVAPGKKAGPILAGAAFVDKWEDRTLGQLFTLILGTMPNDGSAVLTPAETLDLIAYVMSANGFPDGSSPLRNDDAMKDTVIVKGRMPR